MITDFNLLKSLQVEFGFGSQAFICEFNRQNISSVVLKNLNDCYFCKTLSDVNRASSNSNLQNWFWFCVRQFGFILRDECFNDCYFCKKKLLKLCDFHFEENVIDPDLW